MSVATPVGHLFFASPERPDGRVCTGVAEHIGLFCLVPSGQLGSGVVLSIVILVVVASGWRPRITAIPHWWISFSFYSTTNVVDGGDQVAAVVTFLLIPICVTDRRRWHWQSPVVTRQSARVVAHLSLVLIWIQASILYLHASVSKLGVLEWRDGSAVWYWMMFPPFSVPEYMKPAVGFVLSHGPAVLAITWGTLAIEFFLAWCVFARQAVRMAGLVAGWTLHAAIAIALGLPGFSSIMFALLILYLVRPGDSIPRPLSFVTRLSEFFDVKMVELRVRKAERGQKVAEGS
ncbi:sporulation-delaying protein SdpB family protein [Saccharomonospora viridis]|uniref:HTTM-like domain-containing protein n=1 Tax=Saccharomonospora viridis (strain ATCC 15386 / DSM 43017 / JCM 3036 / CCUG 5913 / NBRC 12207 / NCIMB 9602 / P101) TaxID=471857 RepID=C7MYR1_SACVD|nr:sporulation-delaying protein SdpB family protein [Saccharomonospora viridis]ACU98150.1 hypothetical protein Svir_31770 [Saccharomonospora viridis DSM 43017]